jgi:hypothetical protein
MDLVCADANEVNRIRSEIVKTMLGMVNLIVRILLSPMGIPLLVSMMKLTS